MKDVIWIDEARQNRTCKQCGERIDRGKRHLRAATSGKASREYANICFGCMLRIMRVAFPFLKLYRPIEKEEERSN